MELPIEKNIAKYYENFNVMRMLGDKTVKLLPNLSSVTQQVSLRLATFLIIAHRAKKKNEKRFESGDC